MSFTTFSGLSNPFFSAHPVVSPNTATFGTLSALGQVPLVGISGKFVTYSVLNNGVELATGQTASTYTITGLGNNVQIGPVTLVPYDSLGVPGSPFTVNGGSGGGKIYTWAQANAPTFSATTFSGTTLACTGTFSKIYVSYSGGVAGTPASGALINTANSISQAYTGLAGNTTYTFVVYPVNGDGIPGSATGTNTATASVLTLTLPQTLWTAAGSGVNSLAYSTDGINWSGRGDSIFVDGYSVAYSAFQKRWVAAGVQVGNGGGGNTLAYSTDGINWIGLGNSIFSIGGYGVAYSEKQDRWTAAGYGSVHSLAYSFDGINWSGRGLSIFDTFGGLSVAYSTFQDRWVATGYGNTHTLAYSMDGINWTGSGNSIFSYKGRGVAYSAFQNRWVAVGSGSLHTLAYSSDGINWIGSGNSIFDAIGFGVAYSAFQNRWVAAGWGTGNTLAYSMDGINWSGRGTSIFSHDGRGIAYSTKQDRWVAAGNGYESVHSLAYSLDGINWYGSGKSVFISGGAGVAHNEQPVPTKNLVYNFSSLAGTSTTTNGANLMKWTDTIIGLVGTYATSVYHTDNTINSRPTVTGYVTTPYGNLTTPQNSWTFYCVLRTGSTALTGDNNLTLSNGNNGLQITLNLRACYNQITYTVGAASVSGGTSATWTAATNTNYIFAVICSGSTKTTSSTQTYTFRVNGVDFTPASNTDTGRCYYIANPAVGNYNSTTQTYTGEQLLYNTNHSLAYAQNMEQYLSYKWGIGIGATPTVATSSPYV